MKLYLTEILKEANQPNTSFSQATPPTATPPIPPAPLVTPNSMLGTATPNIPTTAPKFTPTI